MKKITRTLIDYSVRYIPVKIVDGTAVHETETEYNFISEKNLSESELRAELARNLTTNFVIVGVSNQATLFSMALTDFCSAAERKEVK